MPKVSLLRCEDYAAPVLKEKILESLTNIDVDPRSFRNARVVVKPNLLMPARDEKAIITHPEFFRAVVQIVKEHGGTPVLVESPAIHSLERVIKKTGYAEVVQSEGVETADPGQTDTLHYEKAHKFKHIDISRAYFEADMILNLPKFKTHGITYITGGVKLLFGAIPGVEKSKMHLRAPTPESFSDFLLDLYGAMNYAFTPRKRIVHIMDAVWVQEGEGPGPTGTPRHLGAVLASDNGIAIDTIATTIAGLDIEKVPTIKHGFDRNYGLSSFEEIDVVGADVNDLRTSGFKPATGASIFSNVFQWPFTTPTFKNLFLDRPVPNEDRCTLCYQCRKICASGAISTANGKKDVPAYDYTICIRCYCCLEICPEGAIQKRKGRLQWLLGG